MALLFGRFNTFIQQKGASIHECLQSSQITPIKNERKGEIEGLCRVSVKKKSKNANKRALCQ